MYMPLNLKFKVWTLIQALLTADVTLKFMLDKLHIESTAMNEELKEKLVVELMKQRVKKLKKLSILNREGLPIFNGYSFSIVKLKWYLHYHIGFALKLDHT